MSRRPPPDEDNPLVDSAKSASVFNRIKLHDLDHIQPRVQRKPNVHETNLYELFATTTKAVSNSTLQSTNQVPAPEQSRKRQKDASVSASRNAARHDYAQLELEADRSIGPQWKSGHTFEPTKRASSPSSSAGVFVKRVTTSRLSPEKAVAHREALREEQFRRRQDHYARARGSEQHSHKQRIPLRKSASSRRFVTDMTATEASRMRKGTAQRMVESGSGMLIVHSRQGVSMVNANARVDGDHDNAPPAGAAAPEHRIHAVKRPPLSRRVAPAKSKSVRALQTEIFRTEEQEAGAEVHPGDQLLGTIIVCVSFFVVPSSCDVCDGIHTSVCLISGTLFTFGFM